MVASRVETSTLISWYSGAVECTVQMAGATSHSLQARSRIATGTGVHRVRSRSDVDLVEKSACIESGNNTSVTRPRDLTVSVERDELTKSPNATRFSTLRPVASVFSRNIFFVPLACSCLQPPHCQVPRRTPVKWFGLKRHGSSGNPVLQGKSLTNRVDLQISDRFVRHTQVGCR